MQHLRSRHIGIVLAAAFAVAGCSAVGIATQPGEMTKDVACPDDEFRNGVRVLSCAEAVQAAEEQLDWHRFVIQSARFSLGVGNCPRMPGEAAVKLASAGSGQGDADVLLLRCTRISRNTSGTVVFTFLVGEPIRMYIALNESGEAVASSSFMDVVTEEAGGAEDPALFGP